MTAFVAFAALILASVVYTIQDNRRTDAARQVDDFFRVEHGCVLREEMLS